jgi:hypothetical protein
MSKRPAAITQAEMKADAIDPDTPLRLDMAAEIAFPNGGMTANGLRREAKRGRLVIERVAGKDYTTLNHIRRMRELCRVSQDNRDSGCEKHVLTKTAPIPPCGLSSTEAAKSALDATLTTLMARNEH